MDQNSKISIIRSVYRTKRFRNKYRNSIRKRQSKFPQVCSKEKVKQTLTGILPVIETFRNYSLNSNFLRDVFAGLAVGVMYLPQGMAYALLANLPVYSGLYTSLFPVFIYFFFGSSRHLSIGPSAMVCLLIGSTVSRYISTQGDSVHQVSLTPQNQTYTTTDVISSTQVNPAGTASSNISDSGATPEDMDTKKLMFASSLCLFVGLFQIALYILRLGFMTTYISSPLISGFITAASIEVLITQIKNLLGITIPQYTGYFRFIKTLIEIIKNVPHINVAALIGSLICLFILLMVRTGATDKHKDTYRIPIPMEFIVLVIGTTISYFGKLQAKYEMDVIGHIPLGFPEPTVPPVEGMHTYISDIFVIGIVSYVQSISIAKILAKKRHYTLDENQDMLAYGFSNIFAAFFSCMPLGASLSRTSVKDSVGRSQVASLFSIGLMLVIIMVIGPWFKSLPTCILSAIVVATLKDMLLEVQEGHRLWSVSKYDFLVWMSTFVGVLIFSFDIGVWIGLAVSIWTVLLRTQRMKARSLENIDETEVYVDKSKYKTIPFPEIRIVGFQSPLYFANAEKYLQQVHKRTGVYPEKIRREIEIHEKSMRKTKQNEIAFHEINHRAGHMNIGMEPIPDQERNNENMNYGAVTENLFTAQKSFHLVKHIILDFSAISFIDIVGCKILKQIMVDYHQIYIDVYLAGINDYVFESLQETGFIDTYDNFIYVTVNDAVSSILTSDTNVIHPNGQSTFTFQLEAEGEENTEQTFF